MTTETLLAVLAVGHVALAGAVVARSRDVQVVCAAVGALVGLLVLVVVLTR